MTLFGEMGWPAAAVLIAVIVCGFGLMGWMAWVIERRPRP